MFCPICQDKQTCERCRRLLAVRKLVEVITLPMRLLGTREPDDIILAGLGALAFLMKERTALIYSHRKDLRDAWARDAYDEGKFTRDGFDW